MDFLRETEGAPFFSALTNAAPAPLLFDFKGHDIRVVELDGTPWFVAADICKPLGLSSAAQTMALSNLKISEVGNIRLKKGGRPNKIITEAVKLSVSSNDTKREKVKGQRGLPTVLFWFPRLVKRKP